MIHRRTFQDDMTNIRIGSDASVDPIFDEAGIRKIEALIYP